MSNVAAASAASPVSPGSSSGPSLWSQGGFSFKDLLDIVNPLQHIPVIGSVYRYLSGDEPSGGSRIVGDTLYGGPIGFGVSVVSSIFADPSGRDPGERVLAAVFGPSNDAGPGSSAVAANQAGVSAGGTSANPALAGGITAMPMPTRPVAMNQLFQSPSPAAAGTPEQTFLAQNALFQRQITNARGTDGRVLNNRPVPLELSSNLLPVVPAATPSAKPGAGASQPGAGTPTANSPPADSPTAHSPTGSALSGVSGGTSGAQPGGGAANPATDPNPIAQKMLDALNKYEQLKKEQEGEQGAETGDPAKVDLSL